MSNMCKSKTHKENHLVYVVNKKGKPLMPTTRFDKVRKLLKSGKAVPICNNPFTIRLKYEVNDYTQQLTLGIDVGRENIGLAVSNEKGECLFLADVQTNNKQITKNMSERKVHRQERRRHKRIKKQRKAIRDNVTIKNGQNDILRNKKSCKSINVSYPGMKESTTHKVNKGKEAKFNNRKRTNILNIPSIKNLVQIHTNVTKLLQEFLPITNIIIENTLFHSKKFKKKSYLYDYINNQQRNKCLLCGKNHIEEYHHIVPQSKNGSNTVSNIAGLCKDCHSLVHKDDNYSTELQSLKAGNKKKHEISLLNSCMQVIIDEITNILPTTCCTGYDTAEIRKQLNIDKTHSLDAYCISLFSRKLNTFIPIIKSRIYQIKHFKKKSNNIIHKLGSRKYYNEDGKLIATNRHKAIEQKEPSLEEYMYEYSKTHTQKETNKHFHSLRVKPAKRIYTYHKTGFISPFKCGDTVYCSYKNINKKELQLTFTCFKVKIRPCKVNTLSDKDKHEYNMKNCILLKKGSLSFI